MDETLSLSPSGAAARRTYFIFLVVAVFGCYSIYAVLQEIIFQRLPGFHFAFFVTFVQFLVYILLSGLQLWRNPEPRRAPLFDYVLVGALSVGTMGLSNQALIYLNFATQQVAKCCKLIPVMICGVLYLGKRYAALEWLAMCCLTGGLIVISLALLADAFIGNVQEKSMTKNMASATEMVPLLALPPCCMSLVEPLD